MTGYRGTAITVDRLGVLPRALVFLGEVVRSGGTRYAAALPEPLPGPAAAVARGWLESAATVVGDATGDRYVKNFGLTDLVGATGSAGSGGRYYFVLRAGPTPGRAAITLHNPHHSASGSGGTDQDERHFTVDVR
ncbi:hypothetical protein ACIRD3_00595 [Kitasatospora sp. NPDC093550]|uniref:hypothetical protein n=1 Tax=Kitasatospora sp. NPDC093550 TaxID=3364089 RepID=UPI00381BBB72